jgi:hypothetical protein
MWIFMSDSALSIVKFESKNNDALGDVLLVRSRAKGDVEKFLRLGISDRALGYQKTLAVDDMPQADYRYRTTAPRWLVSECMAQYIAALDYPNFKNSVDDDVRHTAYTDVWQAMYRQYGGYNQAGAMRTPQSMYQFGITNPDDFQDEDGEWLV